MNPLFTKLMMMTTSDNDQEALTALRKANGILAEAGVNWEEFLNAVDIERRNKTGQSRKRERERNDRAANFSDVQSGKRNGRYDDADAINALFEMAYQNVTNSGFRGFLDSVHTWWEANGFLTEGQYNAVRKAAYK